jgi:hypothetical protein
VTAQKKLPVRRALSLPSVSETTHSVRVGLAPTGVGAGELNAFVDHRLAWALRNARDDPCHSKQSNFFAIRTICFFSVSNFLLGILRRRPNRARFFFFLHRHKEPRSTRVFG